jgi:DNA-binding CsgD family transcriptional regulator/tetratricopeptide (TPR) repeat protein
MPLTSPKLIGRRAEIRLLENALSQCADGRLRLVLLSGPAGIGKTALIRQFTDLARAAGAQVVVAECAQEESTSPFGPLLHSPQSAFFPDAVHADADARGLLLDPLERHRIFAATTERLRLVARERPVVFVLEDVQWSDEETLQLVHYLSRRATDAALLVVATFRSDDAESAQLTRALAELRRRDTIDIALQALMPRQVGVLVGSALGSTERPDAELQSFVADHSGGNPLFVEQLVRGLVERQWLVRGEGTWRSTRPLAEAALPTSVTESVRARLALMPSGTRRILSSAAIIGQKFDFDLLFEITGDPREAVIEALRAGIHAQLIEEIDSSEWRYAFRHALFRDALLGELIGPERQDLHRAVGLALEEGIADAASPSVLRELARHFDAAGDAERAVRYHVLAARSSSGNTTTWPTGFSANADVAAHLARAVALAPTHDPDRAEMLRVYAWAQDDLALRLSIIEQSRAQAETAGDPRGIALSTVMAGVWRAMRGDRSGLTGIRDGIRLLESLGSGVDLADAHFQLARLAMLDGAPDAIALAERAVELARALGPPSLLANALATLGPAMVAAGRIEGIGATRSGLAIAREHRATAAIGRILINLKNCLADSGAPEEEIEAVEREYGREAPLNGERIWWAFSDGRWDEALEIADELDALFGPDPGTSLFSAFIAVARDGPIGVQPVVLRAHEQSDGMLLWRASSLATEVLYLCGDHRGALTAARHVARCLERGVRLEENQGAATAALAAAVALNDQAAIEEWLERCAGRRPVEPRTAEARRAYARGERARREGRPEQALEAFAVSAAGFDRRGSSLLARTLPRLRRVELLAARDPAEAQKELALLVAMWRSVDAKWYLGRIREWATAYGLRGWTASATRGPRPTRRELEVARLVAEGLTNKEIGARLGIAERTAETHVQHIVTKLDLRGRSQLAAWVAGARRAVEIHT